MRNKIIDIIAGKFLLEKTNLKSVRFILFIFFLAVVMIYSSHSVDRKIFNINKLNNEINIVENSYIETRKELMKSKMESSIRKK